MQLNQYFYVWIYNHHPDKDIGENSQTLEGPIMCLPPPNKLNNDYNLHDHIII